MKKIILIIFLLSGCIYNQNNKSNNLSNINFSDALTLEEFINKLEEYADNSSYPNIDD